MADYNHFDDHSKRHQQHQQLSSSLEQHQALSSDCSSEINKCKSVATYKSQTPDATSTSSRKKVKQVQLSFTNPQGQPVNNASSQQQQHHQQLLVRLPAGARSSQRYLAPRLSLLGKPIYLSQHKSYVRNAPSLRWKMRLRAFLEQPQTLLAWLYHFIL